MKKQRIPSILFLFTIVIVAFKIIPTDGRSGNTKTDSNSIFSSPISDTHKSTIAHSNGLTDTLSAWEAFKKIAYNKLDVNAKVITQLKVKIPQGSDNSKRDYLKKISDFERRNDNLRNNLQVIKELANESLDIFKNNFNYENTALMNEMQLVFRKTDPPARKGQ